MERSNPYDMLPRAEDRGRARQSRNRRFLVAVSLVACVAVGLIMWPLVWFVVSYGAKFDFPQALPIPPAATAVTSDDGSDDDDPLRSRQQVVDVPADSAVTPAAFYRQTFPASQGWSDLPVKGEQQLCLVNRNNDKFTEVIEVFNYTGSRLAIQTGRHLVMISRFQSADPDPCGQALPWVSTDLY